MKGIVGRKLGMTQVFDADTGTLTPVTVIEAGPCPVVGGPPPPNPPHPPPHRTPPPAGPQVQRVERAP